ANNHAAGLANQDAVGGVGDGGGSGGVGADVVAHDLVALTALKDVHAVASVAGDDVAGDGAGVVAIEEDALLAVAERGAVDAQANEVVLDQGGAQLADEDAGAGVAGDAVALPSRPPA